MANLRAAQKEMTRQLLLDSGLALFSEKGYAAVTVDDIATNAGTTRVTFYAHFPSKVELMKALITERLNVELGRVPSSEHGSTARDLVAVVADGSKQRIRDWLEEISSHWDAIRPYTTTAFQAAAVDPEIQALIDEWTDEVVGDIEDGLDQADRFDRAGRHLRGILAFTELDHVARHWTSGHWGLDRDGMLDVLTESWHGILGATSH